MDIHHALFWGCGAVCAAAELLILRSLIRPGGDAPTVTALPRSSRGAEIVWGVLPLIALVALFWFAWPGIV